MRFLIDLLSIFAVPRITIQKDGHGGKERTDVIDGGNRRMKLIIDIPDKTYHKIIDGTYDYGDMNVIIQNGTPLDKIRKEVMEYIDDLDIAYEICGVFDNIGKAESEDKNEREMTFALVKV